MSILFINASPNRDGNTVALARELLAGKHYRQLDLPDYAIAPYGRTFADDQLDDVLDAIRAASTVVIGCPLYWHNLPGHLRTFLDRCYGTVGQGECAGRRLVFLFQGAAPERRMLDAGEYTMSRFCGLYGMDYMGMATCRAEARELSAKL